MMKVNYNEVIERLESLARPDVVSGMETYGITAKRVYGVSIPNLRALAKDIRRDHELAQELWETESRETRILASMIEDPDLVTEEQMDRWVEDFDSWEVCDQCCMNLFEKMDTAYEKAEEWSSRDEEFVKRAGFALMARLAVSDKESENSAFEQFLPLIQREAGDDRNYVKKAVNWALRQIGKRNLALNEKAIETANAIRDIDSKSARWIATDAIRELTSESIQSRLRRRTE